MNIRFPEPIIRSILDTDLYKLNMGCVVFHLFPRAQVIYEFINRGNTPFPEHFAEELQHQINLMSGLALTPDEKQWLGTIPYIRPTYVEWFAGYRFNPSEVTITQTRGVLTIKISGPWYRTIYWEVPLMAAISELYFIMTGQVKSDDWKSRIFIKAERLSGHRCHWIDFGARRRYSYLVEDEVVFVMKSFPGFLGTSNPHLAHRHGVPAHGTYAHEAVQAMMALYGVRMANKMWMKHWSEFFEGNLGIALSDTFTTGAFLKDFGCYEAKLFDGIRHDSGDPYLWGQQVLNHYKKLGILTGNKRLVFSDSLNDTRYIRLDEHFREFAQPVGGIGTFFTNDVDVTPLNMVIKMVNADFGFGSADVVKISDDPGKHTGSPKAIAAVKQELKLTI